MWQILGFTNMVKKLFLKPIQFFTIDVLEGFGFAVANFQGNFKV